MPSNKTPRRPAPRNPLTPRSNKPVVRVTRPADTPPADPPKDSPRHAAQAFDGHGAPEPLKPLVTPPPADD